MYVRYSDSKKAEKAPLPRIAGIEMDILFAAFEQKDRNG